MQKSAAFKYDTIITVKFPTTADDPRQSEFQVHRGLITHYSDYFRAALNKETFLEGKNGVIELELNDLDPFTTFFAWLYQRAGNPELESEHIDGIFDDHQNDNKEHRTKARIWLRDCVRDWVFGDMRQAPEFQNWAMSCMITALSGFNNFVFSVTAINYTYEHTMQGSMLRKLLVDSMGRYSRSLHQNFTRGNKSYVDDLPLEATQEVLVAFMKKDPSWPGPISAPLIRDSYMVPVPDRTSMS